MDIFNGQHKEFLFSNGSKPIRGRLLGMIPHMLKGYILEQEVETPDDKLTTRNFCKIIRPSRRYGSMIANQALLSKDDEPTKHVKSNVDSKKW